MLEAVEIETRTEAEGVEVSDEVERLLTILPSRDHKKISTVGRTEHAITTQKTVIDKQLGINWVQLLKARCNDLL